MTKAKKEPNPGKVGIVKFWAWNLRQVSYGAMTIIVGYVTIYCTNTLKMPAALVGTLLLVSKLFDGVTDLLAGYLIDNTKTKLGKGRPYELSIILLWLCTWLLFSASPEWSGFAKGAWVFCMYTFVYSIFGTLLGSNQTAYIVRAFPKREQIERVSTLGGIVISLGATMIGILFPQMVAAVDSAAGWSRLIGMFAIPLTLIGLLRFFFVKEVVDVDVKSAPNISIKELVAVLKTNKYIYIVCAVTLIASITSNINANTYYFTYIVGDIGQLSVLSLIAMPLVLIMFVFPPLLKRFRPIQIIRGGALCGVAGFLISFLAGANMPMLIVGAILYNISYMPINYLVTLLILDCASFNEWKGLSRCESTMTAFQSFGTKVGQGVGSALAGILLGVVGFNGAATAAELNAGSLFMIRALYGLLPTITYTIIFILTFAYKLDKQMPQIEADLSAQKVDAGNE